MADHLAGHFVLPNHQSVGGRRGQRTTTAAGNREPFDIASWQDYAIWPAGLSCSTSGVFPSPGPCTSDTGIARWSRSTPTAWMLVPLSSLGEGMLASLLRTLPAPSHLIGQSTPSPPGDDGWPFVHVSNVIGRTKGAGWILPNSVYCIASPFGSGAAAAGQTCTAFLLMQSLTSDVRVASRHRWCGARSIPPFPPLPLFSASASATLLQRHVPRGELPDYTAGNMTVGRRKARTMTTGRKSTRR
ncbi:uncharacterized protein BDZ83DRAFT_131830 [Colletotrichum acutatum]|uniref:Uncharacterized protein n=1 Tax=Glomerella acutata TaxID=27357 RepID=A0AAD8UDM6_GLOAC|nr:uncharacterized protein BDZ83DRAFT_131830 [Colletotrichum acutatum]KAK1710350.1 hypothetical protein BDZ83DRAFT_131830 [Colletotrichum acutatum]